MDPGNLRRVVTGVLVDANVLFSRTLRDWLFLLRNETNGGMFTVYATEDVLAETLYRLRRKHPDAPGRMISGIHDRVVEQLDECVADYEIDGTFPGKDENDAHVHAAAVASGAQILLTHDTGFTMLDEDVLARLPYEVHTPDSFFVLADDVHSAAVRAVTRAQLDYWFGRDGEIDLVKRVRDAGCPNFAQRVTAHIRDLDWTPPERD